MELLKLYEEYKFSKFEDIKKLLESDEYGLTVKDNDNLYLVTYYRDKNNNNHQTTNLTNKVVKNCRGIILEKETNKIVCYTFNMNDKYDNDIKKLETSYHISSTIIHESIDGTQIRLFYYDNKWNVATTRCINAYNARFYSAKTFGDLFDEALNKVDYSKLDKDKCYGFILCHPENRIVKIYERPSIVHVCTRDMKTLKEVEEDIGIIKPREYKFEDYSKLLTSIDNLEYDQEGYMLKDVNYNRMKIKGKKYLTVKKLRGNNWHILFHYLELKTPENINNFLRYFSEYTNIFIEYANNIRRLAKYIHVEYCCRFVRRTMGHQGVTWQYRPFIYNLHNDYKETRIPRTYNVIYKKLLSLHPAQIIFIYNRTFNNVQLNHENIEMDY